MKLHGKPMGAAAAAWILALCGWARGQAVPLLSANPELDGSFGFAASPVPDLTGDGRSEALVGAWSEDGGAFDSGRAHLYDGATGALLLSLVSPSPEPAGYFGLRTGWTRNADGAGETDLLAGASFENGGASDAGRVYVFDGGTGTLIRTLQSPSPVADGKFGRALAALDDLNADGRGEIAVAAGGENGGAGAVHVLDGATGGLLRTLVSPNAENGGDFGGALAPAGDMTGDSFGELIVGAPFEDAGPADSGRVYVFNPVTGAAVRTMQLPSPSAGALLGISVASLAAWTGDATPDVAAGAIGITVFSFLSAGAVAVFDGGTGGFAAGVISPSPGDYGLFGQSIAGMGDLDGDGRSELAAGAPGEPFLGGGKIHILRASGGLFATLTSPNDAPDGNFGYFCSAMEGAPPGGLLAGAYKESGGIARSGRAYVFDYSPAGAAAWRDYE